MTVVPPLPRSVNVTITQQATSAAPAVPGRLVDGFLFTITSDAGAELPGAVNLSIDYLGGATSGFNPQNFVIARYDGAQYVPVPGSAPDPINTYISATITSLGTYAVYQP